MSVADIAENGLTKKKSMSTASPRSNDSCRKVVDKKSENVSDEKSWVASLIREIVLQEWN